MPHIIVKLWPGKSEKQKQQVTEAITQSLTDILGSSEASISVAIEEIPAEIWKEKVYEPDIVGKTALLYKKPGYNME